MANLKNTEASSRIESEQPLMCTHCPSNQTVDKCTQCLKYLTSGMKELGLHDPESKNEAQQTPNLSNLSSDDKNTSRNRDDEADYDVDEDAEYIPNGTACYVHFGDLTDYLPQSFDKDQPGIYEIPLI